MSRSRKTATSLRRRPRKSPKGRKAAQEVTQSAIAKRLGITPRQVRNLVADGLPTVKRGRQTRYPVADVDRWWWARTRQKERRGRTQGTWEDASRGHAWAKAQQLATAYSALARDVVPSPALDQVIDGFLVVLRTGIRAWGPECAARLRRTFSPGEACGLLMGETDTLFRWLQEAVRTANGYAGKGEESWWWPPVCSPFRDNPDLTFRDSRQLANAARLQIQGVIAEIRTRLSDGSLRTIRDLEARLRGPLTALRGAIVNLPGRYALQLHELEEPAELATFAGMVAENLVAAMDGSSLVGERGRPEEEREHG